MSDTVKVTLTPSEEAVKKALAEFSVTDSAGRVITLRKPGPLGQFRLIEALGAKTAENSVYVGMVLPLIYVTAIDGEIVPPPSSKLEVEALIQQLDEHGLTTVHAGVMEHFGKADPEADKAALKKS